MNSNLKYLSLLILTCLLSFAGLGQVATNGNSVWLAHEYDAATGARQSSAAGYYKPLPLGTYPAKNFWVAADTMEWEVKDVLWSDGKTYKFITFRSVNSQIILNPLYLHTPQYGSNKYLYIAPDWHNSVVQGDGFEIVYGMYQIIELGSAPVKGFVYFVPNKQSWVRFYIFGAND